MADEIIAPKPTLTNIIEDAAVKVAKDVGAEITEEEKTKAPEVKEPPKSETPVEESKVEAKKEPDEEDLNEEQLAFAKNLFKALNSPDPAIQTKTIKVLANLAGLDLKEVETKKEIKDAAESFIDLLKQGLGEFDFLAEKLAPVLEKYIESAITKGNKDIRETLAQQKEREQRSEIEVGYLGAFNKYENSAELQDEVGKLVNEFKPTGKMSHEDYFKSLLLIAAERKGIELKKVGLKETKKEETKEKIINKARSDAGSRLASERNVEAKLGVKIPGKMKLNDAVAAAIEELRTKNG